MSDHDDHATRPAELPPAPEQGPAREQPVAGLPASSTAPNPALTGLQRRALSVLTSLVPAVLELGELFRAAGHELALVGGPVRDAFLGRTSTDLDFATSATPEESERILAGWGDAHWDVGREFGTIGALRRERGAGAEAGGQDGGQDGTPGPTARPGPRGERPGDVVVEVTTYRSDRYDPTSRKPEVAFGDTLEGDLSRRDLTVNAMAVRLPELTFVDPFDGLTDLAAGVLRTPVTPEQSFADDPLRMMRVARFAAQLGFDVDPATAAAITAMAQRIEIVSAERVRDELVKLLVSDRPRRGIEVLVDSGLADHVLPEVPALRLEIDEHHRHKDVYEHSLTVLDQAVALETGPDGAVPRPDLVLRMAALLHDIGKPATRRFEAGGGVSFHHHEVVGAKMTTRRLKALRFDKATIQQVSRLVELHLRFHGYGDGMWTDSAVRRYVTDAGDLLERLHRLTRSDCTTRNRRKAQRLSAAYDHLEERIDQLREQEELAAIRPELDGRQIMQILDVPAGPVIGQAYAFLLELRMERGVIGEEAARAALVEWWAQRGQ